jgi:hypothetical protein
MDYEKLAVEEIEKAWRRQAPDQWIWQTIAIAFVYAFLELVKTLKQNKEK